MEQKIFKQRNSLTLIDKNEGHSFCSKNEIKIKTLKMTPTVALRHQKPFNRLEQKKL